MNIQDLNTAFELIEENGGDFEGEKDISLIEKAQSVLGVTFPPSYVEFLKSYGCGDIEGLEFYGVINDDFENSSVPDAIWVTLDERKSGLPHNLVIVYAAGDGTYYALDTSKLDDNGECSVVSYESNGNLEVIADNYGSFLLDELKTVI